MRENQPHTRVVEPVCVAPLSGQAVFITQHGFILFYFAAFAHPFLSIMLSIQQVKIFNFYLLWGWHENVPGFYTYRPSTPQDYVCCLSNVLVCGPAVGMLTHHSGFLGNNTARPSAVGLWGVSSKYVLSQVTSPNYRRRVIRSGCVGLKFTHILVWCTWSVEVSTPS